MSPERDNVHPWTVREIDGRIALEFKIDSSLSHLIYLTSNPLDSEHKPADLRLNQAKRVMPLAGSYTGRRSQNLWIAPKRIVDKLRDLLLKRPHHRGA